MLLKEAKEIFKKNGYLIESLSSLKDKIANFKIFKKDKIANSKISNDEIIDDKSKLINSKLIEARRNLLIFALDNNWEYITDRYDITDTGELEDDPGFFVYRYYNDEDDYVQIILWCNVNKPKFEIHLVKDELRYPDKYFDIEDYDKAFRYALKLSKKI